METKERKKGDVVEFDHVGFPHKGTIEELLPEGKYKVKDTAGYIYRLTEGAFKKEGAAAVEAAPEAAPTTAESQTTNINNQSQEPMAKKEKAASAAASTADAEQVKKIKALECKKHQRIYLLMAAGCDKGEIMKHAGCNLGEISNVKKQYGDATKVATAKALMA